MNEKLLKMSLQLLADSNDTNAEEDNGKGAEDVNGGRNDHDNDNGSDHEEQKGKPDEDDRNEKKYSENDLDDIIERKLAKWKKQQKKDIDEATKLANMNAEERLEYERDKYKNELETLRQANERAELTKEANKILTGAGINIGDELLETLVSDNAESTKKNITGFIDVFNEEVEKAVTSRIAGKTPKRGKTATLTKEEILKVENPRERRRLISENINLFK